MADPDIRVIFFDAGGTLIHAARKIGYYYAMVALHYGFKADEDILQEGFKRAWEEMKPRDPVQGARVMDDMGWWREMVVQSWRAVALPVDFPFDDYFAEVYELFARPDIWRVYPDAHQALERLREKGMRCGVLSNWDRRLRPLMEAMELSPYFEHMVISSEVGVEKPHPLIFRKAEELYGIRPDQALLLGDQDLFDGQGARRAGWKVGLVSRPGTDLLDALDSFRII